MFPTVFQKLDSSPQSFQAFGKLIVKNWDRKKDAGTYQCILNDANRVRLAALNVKGTSGEWHSGCCQLNTECVFSMNQFFRRIPSTADQFDRCFLQGW